MSGREAAQVDPEGWPTGVADRALVEAIPHSVWMVAATGEVEYANGCARQYAADAGAMWVSLVHPEDVDAVGPAAPAARNTVEPYEVECRIRRSDGSFRWHTVRFTPAGDDRSGPWIATGTDIEEHRRWRAEVNRVERAQQGGRPVGDALRSLGIDDVAEGLYTVDAEGRLTSMNRTASQTLGWEEKDLLGQSVHAVVHAAACHSSRVSEVRCPLRPRPGAQAVHTVNEVFVRRDGTTFAVVCSVAPLTSGGRPPGAVVTFRDMTELRRVDLEASHHQKLESLGRLSAGLAHEINTPIQFVGDNTRFLADAYQDMLDLLLVYRECMAPALGEVQWSERTERAQQAEVKADIEYLAAEIPAAVGQSLEGVERVASLVRAMKSFSYKDSSEQAYADLNEAIRTTLTVARNEVKYVADVVLDLGDLPDVLCHLGDLNQVFLNLLVNAADALKDNTERGEIRITSSTAGPTVVISFADNGPGIPEDIQQSIFEPFFTTKEVGKGTGQGLAMARAVLEKHGGSIEVRSVVGEGAEFVLRLPVAGAQDVGA